MSDQLLLFPCARLLHASLFVLYTSKAAVPQQCEVAVTASNVRGGPTLRSTLPVCNGRSWSMQLPPSCWPCVPPYAARWKGGSRWWAVRCRRCSLTAYSLMCYTPLPPRCVLAPCARPSTLDRRLKRHCAPISLKFQIASVTMKVLAVVLIVSTVLVAAASAQIIKGPANCDAMKLGLG